MADRIQNRRDTKARWEQYNPILLEGEMGIVTDDPNLYKIGDGKTEWNSLPYRGFNGNITSSLTEDNNTVPSNSAVKNALNTLESKTKYLSEEEYQKLISLGQVEEDVTYMIFEE